MTGILSIYRQCVKRAYEMHLLFALPFSIIAGTWFTAANDVPDQSRVDAPFLRLRDTTLEYHGPSEDLSQLTEIRLGWFGPANLDDPLTGDLWWAIRFAIQEANQQTNNSTPGSSFQILPFRLISRWTVDPWGTGVSQLTRMLYEEHPLALLGSVDSAATHLAEQIVAKANLPLVSPISTDKSITLAGVSWMFSCSPSDDAIARVLVNSILNALESPSLEPKTNKVAYRDHADGQGRIPSVGPAGPTNAHRGLILISCTDHESRMTTREVLKELELRRHPPSYHFEISAGHRILARQLSLLTASRPAAVVIIAGAEESAQLVRAIKECIDKDCGPQLFGSQSMARHRFRELAGSMADGVCFPLLFAPHPSDTQTARFAECFQAERQRFPDYTAALAYDAVRLLVAAIRQAGPNRARIREALHSLSPWPGITGEIRFDGTGQNMRTNISMGTIRGNSVALLKPHELLHPITEQMHNP